MERCCSLALQESDMVEVSSLYYDEQVRQFLGGPVSNEQYLRSFQAMISAQAQHQGYYFAVRLLADHQLIGLVSLDPHHDIAAWELSYQFLPAFWKQGYATEALTHLLQFGFQNLKLEHIVAETQAANLNSCRLLEYLGFQKLRQVVRFGNLQIIYECKQSSWQ